MKKQTDIPDLTGKKILIIRLSSLGDILLSTPLIRRLKKKFKDIRLDFVTKIQYQDVLKLNPHISKLFLYKPGKEDISELIDNLKQNEYDAVIDLQNNFRSAEIRRAVKAENYVFNKRTTDKFLLVNFKINQLKNARQIPERYAAAIPGIQLDNEGLELFTANKTSALLKGRNNLIGFAPGSRHFTKMWPKDYYEKLGNLLAREDFTIVLFGGKEDVGVCGELFKNIRSAIDLCNLDDLLQTAADMKECEAIVCNDSGMMHTACAAGVPVLAFYGSTVKEFGFTPYKNRNLILENNSLTCRPCSHIGRELCPKGHFRCMLEVTPEKAFKALMTLVKG
jgi:lipopolysaccharide heptosyltransferase II